MACLKMPSFYLKEDGIFGHAIGSSDIGRYMSTYVLILFVFPTYTANIQTHKYKVIIYDVFIAVLDLFLAFRI